MSNKLIVMLIVFRELRFAKSCCDLTLKRDVMNNRLICCMSDMFYSNTHVKVELIRHS